MTQQEIESRARELAERCVKALTQNERHLGNANPLKETWTTVILRELNLVSLLESSDASHSGYEKGVRDAAEVANQRCYVSSQAILSLLDKPKE